MPNVRNLILRRKKTFDVEVNPRNGFSYRISSTSLGLIIIRNISYWHSHKEKTRNFLIKVKKSILFAYDDSCKANRLYDPQGKRLHTYRNVNFKEVCQLPSIFHVDLLENKYDSGTLSC